MPISKLPECLEFGDLMTFFDPSAFKQVNGIVVDVAIKLDTGDVSYHVLADDGNLHYITSIRMDLSRLGLSEA